MGGFSARMARMGCLVPRGQRNLRDPECLPRPDISPSFLFGSRVRQGREVGRRQMVAGQGSGGIGPDGSGLTALRRADTSRHTQGMKQFDDRGDAGRHLANGWLRFAAV